jgi:hypothetical protein
VARHLPESFRPVAPEGSMMIPLNFVKVADELVEHSSVFVTEDGTVTITVAHYRALMRESGWKQR